jgi:hypothetical protein
MADDREPLVYAPLRVKSSAIACAEKLAERMSDDVREVTKADVMRRAISIGLASLALEYGEPYVD